MRIIILLLSTALAWVLYLFYLFIAVFVKSSGDMIGFGERLEYGAALVCGTVLAFVIIITSAHLFFKPELSRPCGPSRILLHASAGLLPILLIIFVPRMQRALDRQLKQKTAVLRNMFIASASQDAPSQACWIARVHDFLAWLRTQATYSKLLPELGTWGSVESVELWKKCSFVKNEDEIAQALENAIGYGRDDVVASLLDLKPDLLVGIPGYKSTVGMAASGRSLEVLKLVLQKAGSLHLGRISRATDYKTTEGKLKAEICDGFSLSTGRCQGPRFEVIKFLAESGFSFWECNARLLSELDEWVRSGIIEDPCLRELYGNTFPARHR